MTTIERATTTRKAPAKKAATRHRRPAQQAVSSLYSGDPIGLLHHVKADLGVVNPDDAALLIEAFYDEAGLTSGTMVPADEVRAFFMVFVRFSVTTMLRNGARTTEKTAPLPGQPVTRSAKKAGGTTPAKRAKKSGVKVDPVAQRRKALATVFFNGHDFVEWGTATVEDHEARIAYLSRRRDGINATIARHQEAIDMIEAAGVTCLADLEP